MQDKMLETKMLASVAA